MRLAVLTACNYHSTNVIMRFHLLLLCQKCQLPCRCAVKWPNAPVMWAGDVVAVAVWKDIEAHISYVGKYQLLGLNPGKLDPQCFSHLLPFLPSKAFCKQDPLLSCVGVSLLTSDKWWSRRTCFLWQSNCRAYFQGKLCNWSLQPPLDTLLVFETHCRWTLKRQRSSQWCSFLT